jgi:hypothetical protein
LVSGPAPRPVQTRFDEFVRANNIQQAAVDQFDEYRVDIELPADWEPFDSAPGTRTYIWRADPFIQQFCANVVLTMTRLETVLDPAEVFSMLCEGQLHTLPGSHETLRDVGEANDAGGVSGILAMQVDTGRGLVDSISLTHVVNNSEQTLIAQLTFTALRDSPVDCDHIRLIVKPRTWALPTSAKLPGAGVETAPGEGH